MFVYLLVHSFSLLIVVVVVGLVLHKVQLKKVIKRKEGTVVCRRLFVLLVFVFFLLLLGFYVKERS